MTSETMNKHTPGPWAVEDPMGADVGLMIVQDGLPTYDWVFIAGVYTSSRAEMDGRRRISRKEQEANARLIAAAPDMLAEIEKQIGWLRHIRTRIIDEISVGTIPSSVLFGVDQSIKFLTAVATKARGEG